MLKPKNETEDLLISVTKNCGALIKQTHTKPEETLKFKLTKPKETFRFNPSKSVDGSWMVGLISLEVYNFFNITDENYKFEPHTNNFDEFSFGKLKDELAEILIFLILNHIIYNMKK